MECLNLLMWLSYMESKQKSTVNPRFRRQARWKFQWQPSSRPHSTESFRPPMKARQLSTKACQHLTKPLRQWLKRQRRALKRHQLAINDHRQALNLCKQPINALASSPDDLVISINNRAILTNTRANSLNPFAARPDDLESSITPANPQFYAKGLNENAHRFNLFTRHHSTNTPAI